jgi:hypothetical protein
MILHSTETDSAPGCVDALCKYLDGWANPTFVWDPWTGDMAMCGRADMGMGALVTGNNDGSVVIQVEAVGRAGVEGSRPFMDSPMIGWTETILPWLDSWGIPHVFPAGPPLPYPQSYGAGSPRNPNTWLNQSGYFAHSQVPGNDHGDPGLVDLAKIFPSTEDDLTPEQDNILRTCAKAIVQLAGVLGQLASDEATFRQLVIHGDATHYSLGQLGKDVAAIEAAVKAVPPGTGDPGLGEQVAALSAKLDNLTLTAKAGG